MKSENTGLSYNKGPLMQNKVSPPKPSFSLGKVPPPKPSFSLGKVPRFYQNPITGRLIKSSGKTYNQLKKEGYFIQRDKCLYNKKSAQHCFKKLLTLYPNVHPSSNFINIPKTFKHGSIRAFIKHPNKNYIIGYINKSGKRFRLRRPIITSKKLPIVRDHHKVLHKLLEKKHIIKENDQQLVEHQIKHGNLFNIIENTIILFNPIQNDFVPINKKINLDEEKNILEIINSKLAPQELPPIIPNFNVSGIIIEDDQIIGIVDKNNQIKRFNTPIKIITTKKQLSLKEIPMTTEEEILTEEELITKEEILTEEEPITKEEPITEEEITTEEEPITEEVTEPEVTEEEITTEEEPITEEEITTKEEPITEEEITTKEEPITEEEVTEEPTETVPETTEEPITETLPTTTEEITEEITEEPTETTQEELTETVPETTQEELTETVPETTEEITEEPTETVPETTEEESTETVPETTEEILTEEEPTETVPKTTEEILTEEEPMISEKLIETLPSVTSIKKSDYASLQEKIKSAPEIKKEEEKEILEKIQCLDGEQFDVNENRCLPCTYYGLVWDPEYQVCKPMLRKDISKEKEKHLISDTIGMDKIQLLVDTRDNLIGYMSDDELN